MSLADRLMLAGFGVIVVIFGLALWSLGGKNPHIRWLEWLERKKFGSRQKVALIIALMILVVIMGMIAVDAFTRPHGPVK